MKQLKKIIPACMLMLCLCGVYLFAMPTYGGVYFSGIYGNNQIDILFNSEFNENLIYQTTTGTASQAMVPWNGLAEWQTCSITMPANNNIGFHSDTPEVWATPVFWEGEGTPPLSYFSPLESDPIGDHLFTSAWLDITNCEVCFSGDRLYFAMKNNSTSFPISSGLTYFAYMPILVDPASKPDEGPVVFGLMYTVIFPGIMTPGLYKITGTGTSDLTLIGNIESSVVDQTLILSCSMEDLAADPDFMEWFNPQYPLVTASATTSKITLVSGSQQADMTNGARLLLTQTSIPSANAFAPMLSEPLYAYEPGEQATLMASIVYSDLDGNFPRIASVSVDGGDEYPLVPDTTFSGDFINGERFTSPTIYLANTWNQARFRFSHGDSFVYYTLNSSAIDDEEVLMPIPKLSIYPNPARNSLTIKSDAPFKREVSIYNLRGQKVMACNLSDAKSANELDISQLSPGVYFVQDSAVSKTPQKFVKLR